MLTNIVKKKSLFSTWNNLNNQHVISISQKSLETRSKQINSYKILLKCDKNYRYSKFLAVRVQPSSDRTQIISHTQFVAQIKVHNHFF